MSAGQYSKRAISIYRYTSGFELVFRFASFYEEICLRLPSVMHTEEQGSWSMFPVLRIERRQAADESF
ncbi:hypothetical protein SBA5_160022 [Candidatus Sulfotelmatomonas gaucii]|uniref:Uncharacterized protein n=1 Tax=Candidatus Sulfuritelmatomonas gaucii TaxID=2043161 RepID=A0A2N9L5E7_9BACT|nr:hypothetical protein SBA5_160022 [Candidatus Sulfotelmatomonas gaucii]